MGIRIVVLLADEDDVGLGQRATIDSKSTNAPRPYRTRCGT